MQFVKGFYRRPFEQGGVSLPEGGGRVNHLTARPALALFYPRAGGVCASRSPARSPRGASCSNELPFATGYGVEIAMLIDVWRRIGLEGIAQVDLEVHHNRHQPLSAAHADGVHGARHDRAPAGARGAARACRGRPARTGRRALAAREPARATVAGPRRAGRVAVSVRCLYLDLDGTLLGRGASLLHDGEGGVSIDGVRAIQACLRADVEVVLMSGRRRVQVAEDARLLGQSSYIYEAGACVVLEGEEHWLTGDMLPGELTIAQQIERSGAPALLLEHYAGRLEHHEPWHTEREVSHLFRGLVDADEADRLLAEHGHGDLRLVDNGAVSRRSPALAGLEQVRGYHLVPAGGLEGRRGRLPPPRARLRARRDLRGGRLARGPRLRRARAGLLAGRQRARARLHDRARRSPRVRTCVSARPRTAPVSTRPWSSTLMGA